MELPENLTEKGEICLATKNAFISNCRICLDQGSIPIYNGNYSESGLYQNICMIGDIEMQKDDPYPKHLCMQCFKNLQTALEFRQMAKETDKILKRKLNSSDLNKKDHGVNEDLPLVQKDDLVHLINNSLKSVSVEKHNMNSNLQQVQSINDNNRHHNIKDKLNFTEDKVTAQSVVCDQTILKDFLQDHNFIHEKSLHLKKSSIKCKLCPYEAYNTKTLNIHTLRLHSNEKKSISKAKVQHATNPKKNKSEQVSQSEKLLSIPASPYKRQCNRATKRKPSTSMYAKYFKNSGFKNVKKCILCHKYVRLDSLKEHYDILHNKAVGQTDDNTKFNTHIKDKQSLQRHISAQISNQNECYKFFKEIEIASNKKFQCQICDKILNKSSIKMHYKVLHTENTRMHLCDICGKSVPSPSYTSHKYTHNKEFRFECKMCPYKSNNQGLLRSHMRSHSNKSYYQCDICSRHFNYKCNIIRHMRRHMNRPGHKCDICKKLFIEKYLLTRHIKNQHSVINFGNHVCDLCNKVFTNRTILLSHQRKEHGKRIGQKANYKAFEF